MILITSGAYTGEALTSELGSLPPAFLPVSNKRLFQLQIESLKKLDEQIYISIPEDFKVHSADQRYLDKNNVKLIQVPTDLSLGNSILYCWNSTGIQYESLKIYHGDTLIHSDQLNEKDYISIDINDGFYERASFSDIENYKETQLQEEGLEVLSGFFSFSRPALFFKSIIESKGNFIKSLSDYHKAIGLKSSNSNLWLDFGHLNSFFQSRTKLTTERAFNNILIKDNVVTKKSNNEKKINAESRWFQELPREISNHIPCLLDYSEKSGQAYYKIEYLYNLPLSDLFVFGKLKNNAWVRIFKSCKELLEKFQAYSEEAPDSSFNDLYLKKTMERLDQLDSQNLIDSNRKYIINNTEFSLRDLALQSSKLIEKNNQLSIVHGDFCFSNILYDGRSNMIKLIDPRGLCPGNDYTIFGDPRYDIAKLFHSVIGKYDLIISGRYQLKDEDSHSPEILFDEDLEATKIEQSFLKIFFENTHWNYKEILAINVHLFISMLPLHFDNPKRQKGMLINALNLYKKLLEIS